MKEKIIGFFICTLLIFTGILPVAGTIRVNTDFSHVGSRGYIQGLIDNASDGDSIYIPSGIYYENIIINKSISLIGEDRETTIIDGNFSNESVVVISADSVDFSGFTVQKSNYLPGFIIASSRNYIHHCKIRYHNTRGMRLQSGFSHNDTLEQRNTIAYNIFENNDWGLLIHDNMRTTIMGNIAINNTGTGICVVGLLCTIRENVMVDNGCGLWMGDYFNWIVKNEIRGNRHWGLFVSHGNFNIITQNNFIDNGFEDGEDSYFTHASYHMCFWQCYSRNYWSPRKHLSSDSSFPYLILREMVEYTPLLFNIDWLPAKEPYDIPRIAI